MEPPSRLKPLYIRDQGSAIIQAIDSLKSCMTGLAAVHVLTWQLLGQCPQESFFGHMKDSVKKKKKKATSFEEVKTIIDDYIDYYNNERYQWKLAKPSPNEFYEYVTTGVYPLDVPMFQLSIRFRDRLRIGNNDCIS